MKRLLNKMLALCIILFPLGCSDDDITQFTDEGIVIGQDYRKCFCCGGWVVEIDGNRLRFGELPGNAIDLDAEIFPFKVELDWISDPNSCMDDEIIVQRVEKL